MGGGFAWRADAQPRSDSRIRKPGARKAQIAAQNSFHRERQWIRPRRPGSGKGAGEGRLGLFWRYLHGRGHCRSPEWRPKADPGAHKFRAGRRISASGARPLGGDPSLRTVGVTQSRGSAPRRQEARAVPFEDRYGNEPARHRFRRRGMLCAATGEVQASAAYRHLFAFRFIGSLHGYGGWPADMRTRRAILRLARAPARDGDRSGHRAPGERPGVILYGYHPGYDPMEKREEAEARLPLKPVMSLRSRIISLRSVAAGAGVGYNATFVTKRASRIGVLAAGYGDGIHRSLGNRGNVLLRGKLAPIVGIISMDVTMIDITDIEDAAIGDVATIHGTDGTQVLPANRVARSVGTVTSDLLCAVSQRVPRLYVR